MSSTSSKFYTEEFEWTQHAVCMRLADGAAPVDKFTLPRIGTNEEQWVIEDPFDLEHNLAGNMTKAGRAKVLEEFRIALTHLRATGDWDALVLELGTRCAAGSALESPERERERVARTRRRRTLTGRRRARTT